MDRSLLPAERRLPSVQDERMLEYRIVLHKSDAIPQSRCPWRDEGQSQQAFACRRVDLPAECLSADVLLCLSVILYLRFHDFTIFCVSGFPCPLRLSRWRPDFSVTFQK